MYWVISKISKKKYSINTREENSWISEANGGYVGPPLPVFLPKYYKILTRTDTITQMAMSNSKQLSAKKQFPVVNH